MSIQITLGNPFANLARKRPAGLLETITPGQGQFIAYRRFGPIQPGRAEQVLATLMSATPMHLLVRPITDGGDLELAITVGGEKVSSVPLLAADAPPLNTWEAVWAHPQVAQTIRQMRAGGRRPMKSLAWALAAVALAGLGILLAAGLGGQPTAPAPLAQAGAAAGAPQAPQDLLSDTERKLLSDIVAQSGIALDPSVKGKPFVVFSDPNCPACRKLEEQLAAMEKTQFTPIVVPVSFKDGSPAKVAGVLCSGDVAAQWSAAAQSDGAAAPSCPKGEAQAQQNNAAFIALRFSSTPTIVAPNGRIISGVGAPDQLVQWLKENS